MGQGKPQRHRSNIMNRRINLARPGRGTAVPPPSDDTRYPLLHADGTGLDLTRLITTLAMLNRDVGIGGGGG